MNLREAAQQALDELIAADGMPICNETDILDLSKTIETLRAALAEDAMQRLTDVQQEMEATIRPEVTVEPVAWIGCLEGGIEYGTYHKAALKLPDGVRFDLYTAPPKRKPLTDEEIHDCFQQKNRDKATERRMIARAIERAHGIGGEE